ncbi:MAG: preprotein translocase subunit SecY [Clostridia bacterium]|nr:preprotein translocase subunit SecY [Clostridia bacterium]MBP5593009.1 preprotein translocase subunit SecY [Clostridia bacterium]MBP5649130.1 preprotein translocase subunit SecY [Clostridia bacterium]
MFQTIANAFRNKEVRTKLFLTLLILFIYRVGCWIPVPGLDTSVLQTGSQAGGAFDATASGSNTFLALLNGITGDALKNGALLALGISPYINASIISQLLTIAIPVLQNWSREGDEGRKKMANFTRVLTVILALVQAIGIVYSFSQANYLSTGSSNVFSVNFPDFVFGMLIVLVLVSGSVFTMWLGEKLTDIGIGNGISLLIFVGILSTAGLSIVSVIQSWIDEGPSSMAPWYLLIFFALVIVIFGLITFIDGAERKIPVQYAKMIKGRKQYGGQSTFIPIKVNASGVLPIIFATAVITFPQLIMQLFNAQSNWWIEWFGSGQPLYFVLAALLIFGFSYFYAKIQFKPDEVARNLQQYGGFIPGIRPGKPTVEYLGRINNRLTFFGALYLAFVFVVPSVVFSVLNSTNILTSALVSAFSSTGMMIVVSVALEFQKQLEAQLMMRQYKGFLNK